MQSINERAEHTASPWKSEAEYRKVGLELLEQEQEEGDTLALLVHLSRAAKEPLKVAQDHRHDGFACVWM